MIGARDPAHTLVLGHRGSPREATENTLRAFDLAMRAGADGVELDIQRSRDGVPVVVHDDDLDRTMAVRGVVARLDHAAIQRLTGAALPSFEQAAAWAAASGALLNVELKAAGIEEPVLEILGRTRLLGRTFISSFDPEIVRRVGEIGPSTTRFFLTERWDSDAIEAFGASGASGVCLRHDAADPTTLALLATAGVPAVIWTVNDAARIRELLRAGVYAIITDDPAMAVREREALTAR